MHYWFKTFGHVKWGIANELTLPSGGCPSMLIIGPNIRWIITYRVCVCRIVEVIGGRSATNWITTNSFIISIRCLVRKVDDRIVGRTKNVLHGTALSSGLCMQCR